MKNQIISLMHKAVTDAEFVRKLPKDFGHQPVICSPRVNLRYLYTGYESVDAELLSVARKYIKPGQNVWDIGANIGIFAFATAYMAGANGHVLAVEADDRHTQLLRKSGLRSLSKSATVDVINAAISDKIGITELNIVETGNTKNYIVETSGCGQTGDILYKKHVVSVTLDWLLSHFSKPDFIKIDVEGAELMVLQGAEEILHQVKPVFYLEAQEYNQQEVTKILKNANYQLYALDFNSDNIVEIEQCGFNTLAFPIR